MNGPFDTPFINQQVPPIAPGPASVTRGTRRRGAPGPPHEIDPKLARKRQKAAERQRNKRQRDRQREREMQAGSSAQPNADGAYSGVQPQPGAPGVSQAVGAAQQDVHEEPPYVTEMKRMEEARRDKVRSAARERQRKHRALVKQRKMQELGIMMGEDGAQPLEEVHYALGPDGQYQPIHHIVPQPPEMNGADPAQFPPGQHAPQTGGQTFASTMLLSFSCSPMLKQHILRTLHMTNEELSSLEPVLAAAWEQWNAARHAHYAEQAAKASAEQNGTAINGAPPPNPFVPQPPPGMQDPNDFRTRFHRPLTAPSPFGATPLTTAPATTPGGSIDPSLSNGVHGAHGVLAQVVQAATAAAAAQAKQNTEKEGEKAGSHTDGEGKSDGEGSVVDGKTSS